MTEPESAAEQTEQRETPPSVTEPAPAVASTARRQIFENITHTLTDDELTNPAVVKLIIDRMHTAESQREEFKKFVALYYAADKKVGVLDEKLNTNKMIEVFFGTGLALGGAAAGFAAYFWDKDRMAPGIICMSFTIVLVVVSVLVRVYGPKK